MTVPRVLSDPPWRQKVVTHAPPVGSRAVPPAKAATLVWEEGEEERFRGKPPPKLVEKAEERLFEKLLDELDKKAPLRAAEVARLGDEKLAELAGELGPQTTDASTMKLALARVGAPFLANAVSIVRAAVRERNLFEAAMPIRSPELARNAAAAYFEREIPASLDGPYVRSDFEAWMLRHPEAVAHGLGALAVDESNAAHRIARAGLAFLAAHGKMEAIRAAVPAEIATWLAPFASLAPLASQPALAWGLVLATRGMDHRALAILGDAPEVKAYAARVRHGDEEKQLAAVPEGLPLLPAFFDTATLPHPHLLDGTPLPDDALRALGEMLRFSPLANPYIGVAQVRDACDAASLDAFAADLFARWRSAGEDPREQWAFESCGKIGGEACAREVAERIRGWARGADAPRYGWDDDAHRVVLITPGSRGYAFARTGCAILAAQDTDYGRMHLADLAKTGVQVWLRKEAHRALGEEDVEDFEELDTDAPVPSVGLDPDGSAKFDIGARTFTLIFDEGLTPHLVDSEGKKQATFPRSRKDDDEKKYAAEKDRFAAITKDAKTVARYQVALLDRVMCSQHAFTPEAFRARYITHPFLRHLGRRVVWLAGDQTFRIAEDGSFADAGDATFDPAALPVTVAHPVAMSQADREAWATRFADYRLMQPFPQLAREIFVRTAGEIGERNLSRFAGKKTARGRLFQLGRRGWRARFGPDMTEYIHMLPCGASARFEVRPPISRDAPEDVVYAITTATCSFSLDSLPAIDYSELVRDLEYAIT